MEGHETWHTGIKPFKCNKCDYKARYKLDLRKHQRVHSECRNFKCHLCPHKAKCKSALDRHLVIHTDIRQFSCLLCSASFRRKSGLKTHMTRHSSDKPFECDQCGYTCRIQSMLQMHKKSHSDVRKFECTYPGCTQKCKTKSDLKKHSSVHVETLEFACHLCGKEFKSRHSLSSHIKRHLDKSIDFSCSICAQKMTTRFGLRKHLLNHYMGKKHACQVCGHKFYSISNLKNHMKLHDEDRTVGCPICHCRYRTGDTLSLFSHIGYMHIKDYTYFCEACKKPFRTVMRMKLHVQRCHGGDLLPEDKCEFIYDETCMSSQNRQCHQSDNNQTLSCGDVNTESNSNTKSEIAIAVVGEYKNENITRSNAHIDNVSLNASCTTGNGQGDALQKRMLGEAIQRDDHGQHPGSGKSSKGCHTYPVVVIEKISSRVNSNNGNGEYTFEDKLNDKMMMDDSFKTKHSQNAVFKIGSIGGIGVCIARNDSGIQFSGKKGKKLIMGGNICKRKRGEVRKMKKQVRRKKSNKICDVTQSAERTSLPLMKLENIDPTMNASGDQKFPSKNKAKRKENLSRSFLNSLEAKVLSRGVPKRKRKIADNSIRSSENHVLSIETPKKKGKASSGEPKGSYKTLIQRKQDGQKRKPPPVNFDVRVRCLQLNPDQLFSLNTSTGSYIIPDSYFSSNFAGDSKNYSKFCSSSSPNALAIHHRSVPSNHGNKKVNQIKHKDVDNITKDKAQPDFLTKSAQIYVPSSGKGNITIASKSKTDSKMKKRVLSPTSQSDTKCVEKHTRTKSPSFSSNDPEDANDVLIKANQLTIHDETQEKNMKKSEKSKRKRSLVKEKHKFVEESRLVTSVTDSPIRITWKTMAKISDEISPNRCQDLNIIKTQDQKNVPQEESSTALSNFATDKKPNCTVQLGDIAQIYNLTGLDLSQSKPFNLKSLNTCLGLYNPPLNVKDHSSEDRTPFQTVSFKAFEAERRQKKKIVAKVGVISQREVSTYMPDSSNKEKVNSSNDSNQNDLPDTTDTLITQSIADESLKSSIGNTGSLLKKKRKLQKKVKNKMPSIKSMKSNDQVKISVSPEKPKKVNFEQPNISVSCYKECLENSNISPINCFRKKKSPSKTVARQYQNPLNRSTESVQGHCENKNESSRKSVKLGKVKISTKKGNTIKDKNVVLPSMNHIMDLWKMSFECLTNKPTVHLYDYKCKLALGLEKSDGELILKKEPDFSAQESQLPTLFGLDQECFSNQVEYCLQIQSVSSESLNEEIPLVNSNASSGFPINVEAVTNSTNILESIHDCNNTNSSALKTNHVASLENCDEKTVTFHEVDKSSKDKQLFTVLKGENRASLSKKVDVPSKSVDENIAHQDDHNICHLQDCNTLSIVIGDDKLLKNGGLLSKDVDVPSRPINENITTNKSLSTSQSQDCNTLSIVADANLQKDNCQMPESWHASQVKVITPMYCNNSNTSASVITINNSDSSKSDFFHRHAKDMKKIFPPWLAISTSKRLETYFNKWSSLPLPMDFFMNKHGRICQIDNKQSSSYDLNYKDGIIVNKPILSKHGIIKKKLSKDSINEKKSSPSKEVIVSEKPMIPYDDIISEKSLASNDGIINDKPLTPNDDIREKNLTPIDELFVKKNSEDTKDLKVCRRKKRSDGRIVKFKLPLVSPVEQLNVNEASEDLTESTGSHVEMTKDPSIIFSESSVEQATIPNCEIVKDEKSDVDITEPLSPELAIVKIERSIRDKETNAIIGIEDLTNRHEPFIFKTSDPLLSSNEDEIIEVLDNSDADDTFLKPIQGDDQSQSASALFMIVRPEFPPIIHSHDYLELNRESPRDSQDISFQGSSSLPQTDDLPPSDGLNSSLLVDEELFSELPSKSSSLC